MSYSQNDKEGDPGERVHAIDQLTCEAFSVLSAGLELLWPRFLRTLWSMLKEGLALEDRYQVALAR